MPIGYGYLLSSFESEPLSICFSPAPSNKIFISLASGHIVAAETQTVLYREGVDQKANFYCVFKGAIGGFNGISWDASGHIIACHTRKQNVYKIDNQDLSELLVSELDKEILIGPNSVAVNQSTGHFFFTDAGLTGDTGLHNISGSLFTSSDLGVLIPISHKCLAYPSAVCISSSGNQIYVAEKAKNRILRYFKSRESNYWESSVFAQLAGGCGPIAIAVTKNDNLFVAHSEVPDGKRAGKISILNHYGEIEQVVLDVISSDISAMAISADEKVLLIALKSRKEIYSYEIL